MKKLAKNSTILTYDIHCRPNPKTLNFENRSNSAPNVALNSVLRPIGSADQKILVKYPPPLDSQSSHSTQASPTNTLKHVKRRQRARSADESKILLSPREQIQTEDWNIDASEILMGPRIGELIEVAIYLFFYIKYYSRLWLLRNSLQSSLAWVRYMSKF